MGLDVGWIVCQAYVGVVFVGGFGLLTRLPPDKGEVYAREDR